MSRAHGSGGRIWVLILAGVAAFTLTLLVAGPAVALGDGGVLVEPGAEEVDRAGLASVVQQARADGIDLSVAVLAEDPSDGGESEADRLVDRVGGVVLVLSPGEVAAVSDAHDDRAVDRAFDAAGDHFSDGGDVVAGVRAFAGALSDDGGSSGGGGFGGMLIPILIIGVIAFLVIRMVRARGRGHGVGRADHPGSGDHGTSGFGAGGFGHTGSRRRRSGVGSGFFSGAVTSSGNRNRSSRRSSTRSSSSRRSRGSSSRSRSRASRSRGRSSRRR